jgi:predicted DNA-binding transcriptional regulator AlpA
MDPVLKDSPLKSFDTLPSNAFVRFPVVCALWAVSASTGRRFVEAGVIPNPYKIGPRIRCWRVGDLRDRLAAYGQPGAP